MPSYDLFHKSRDLHPQHLTRPHHQSRTSTRSTTLEVGRTDYHHGKRRLAPPSDEQQHQRTSFSRGGVSRAGPLPPPPSSLLQAAAISGYTSAPVMCRTLGCDKLFHSVDKMERHFREQHGKGSSRIPDARAAGGAAAGSPSDPPKPPVESWESRRNASLALFDQRAPSLTSSPRSIPPSPERLHRSRSREISEDLPAGNQGRIGAQRGEKLGPALLVRASTLNPKLRDPAYFSGPIAGGGAKTGAVSGPLLSGPEAQHLEPPSLPVRKPRFGALESFSGPQSASKGRLSDRTESGSASRVANTVVVVDTGSPRGGWRTRLSDPGPSDSPLIASSCPSSAEKDLYPKRSQMGAPPQPLERASNADPSAPATSGKAAKKGSLRAWPFGAKHETAPVKAVAEPQPSARGADRHQGLPPRSLHRDLESAATPAVDAERRGAGASRQQAGAESSSNGRGVDGGLPPAKRETFLQRLSRRSFSPKSAARATEGILDSAGKRTRAGRAERAERGFRSLSAPRGFLAALQRLGSPIARGGERGGEEAQPSRRRASGPDLDAGRDPDSSSFSWSSSFFSRVSQRFGDTSPAKSGPLPVMEWPGVTRDWSPRTLRGRRGGEGDAERSVPSGPASDADGGGWSEFATPEGGTPRKGIGSKLMMALKSNPEKGRFGEDGMRASWEGTGRGDSRSGEQLSTELHLACDVGGDECQSRFSTEEELELHRRIYHSVVPLWVRGGNTGSSIGGLMGAGWLKGPQSQQMGVFESALDIRNTPASEASFETYRQSVIENAAANGKFWKTPSHGTIKCKQDGNEVQRFYGTSIRCNLGINDRGRLCDSDRCELCCVLRSGFKFKKTKAVERFGWGIHTSSTVHLAHENYEAMAEEQNLTKRAAILVCQVIAGRVCRLPNAHIVGPPPGFDSVAIQRGGDNELTNYDELIVFDKRALLPLYAIIYRPVNGQ